MAKIIMNMITQRSVEEGAAMEKGKTNPDYFEA
jgi:formylmethanofuran dehydrogenase subunit D